jgi:hypothetical protein
MVVCTIPRIGTSGLWVELDGLYFAIVGKPETLPEIKTGVPETNETPELFLTFEETLVIPKGGKILVNASTKTLKSPWTLTGSEARGYCIVG